MVLDGSRGLDAACRLRARGRRRRRRGLGSTNGTFVNDQRLSGSRQLQAGDRVRLGNTVLEVRAPAPAVEPAADAVMPEVAVTRQRQIPTLPVLVFVAGQNAGSEMPSACRSCWAATRRRRRRTRQGRRDLSAARQLHAVGGRADGGGPRLDERHLRQRSAADQAQSAGRGRPRRGRGDRDRGPASRGDGRRRPAPTAARAGRRTRAPRTASRWRDSSRQFGDHRAVDGIDLFVNPGEIYGFLGPNGAGKSTTVHMLVTLLPPIVGQGPRGRLRRRHAGRRRCAARSAWRCRRRRSIRTSTPGSTWTSRRPSRAFPGQSASSAGRSCSSGWS